MELGKLAQAAQAFATLAATCSSTGPSSSTPATTQSLQAAAEQAQQSFDAVWNQAAQAWQAAQAAKAALQAEEMSTFQRQAEEQLRVQKMQEMVVSMFKAASKNADGAPSKKGDSQKEAKGNIKDGQEEEEELDKKRKAFWLEQKQLEERQAPVVGRNAGNDALGSAASSSDGAQPSNPAPKARPQMQMQYQRSFTCRTGTVQIYARFVDNDGKQVPDVTAQLRESGVGLRFALKPLPPAKVEKTEPANETEQEKEIEPELPIPPPPPGPPPYVAITKFTCVFCFLCGCMIHLGDGVAEPGRTTP